MKFVRIAGLALAAGLAATSVQAADLFVEPIQPIAPAPSWTGPYIGANIGYSWGPWDATGTLVSPTGAASPSVNGVLGGLQAGYNWQTNNWFWGIEADIQITGEDDTTGWTTPAIIFGALAVPGNVLRSEWEFPWFGTLRARTGFASPDYLLYVTGGLAFGKAEYTFTNLTTGASLSDDTTKAGWTIGLGAERAIGDRWSAKLEYLYVDLGDETFLAGTANPVKTELRDHIVRLGVNYRFDSLY
jgi:outer membrane immunogenic protein